MAKSILVADDNPKIREQVCRLFESEEHYEVCAEAGDGQEAIDLALKHRPDLIVLDLSMPLRNGFEVECVNSEGMYRRVETMAYIVLCLKHQWRQLYSRLSKTRLLNWDLYLNLRDIMFVVAKKV